MPKDIELPATGIMYPKDQVRLITELVARVNMLTEDMRAIQDSISSIESRLDEGWMK